MIFVFYANRDVSVYCVQFMFVSRANKHLLFAAKAKFIVLNDGMVRYVMHTSAISV